MSRRLRLGRRPAVRQGGHVAEQRRSEVGGRKSEVGSPPLQSSILPLFHASILTLCLCLAMLLGAPARGEPAASAEPPIRFGMSARTIAGINRADAVAALKVWIESIARERKLPVEPDPRLFDRREDMAAALGRGEIDVLTVPTDEFLELERIAPMAALYCQTVDGKASEEYVLLVREESPHRALADLRGGRLLVLSHPTAALARIWMDVELARDGLPAAGFFREIVTADKVNRAILPVFFKQADACLVTRRGFAVAGELNPQVRKQLRVVASSPPLIPNITTHRLAVSAALSRGFRDAALNLADTPAGRQMLDLFQNDGFVELAKDELAPTRALLREHSRLTAGESGTEATP